MPELVFAAGDVVAFHTRLDALGVLIWIDGGWAVDALLGVETRVHEDLDIVIQEKDVGTARSLLEDQGYRDVPRDDTSPWNFVLGDGNGREIDFHVIVLDDGGNGLYGPTGMAYPSGSLDGIGVIGGLRVRCISPEFLVEFHTGYPPRDRDFQDVAALCERFGIALPDAYRRQDR